jgi:hypothetical protein
MNKVNIKIIVINLEKHNDRKIHMLNEVNKITKIKSEFLKELMEGKK